jgi:hypothetical protein
MKSYIIFHISLSTMPSTLSVTRQGKAAPVVFLDPKKDTLMEGGNRIHAKRAQTEAASFKDSNWTDIAKDISKVG